MATPETIIPAAPGTLYLQFQFVPRIKASNDYVKENTIKRSVVGYKLEAGRPMPVVLGLPIELDMENFEGVTAIAVPGVGLVDPLVGKVWRSDEIFIMDITAAWKGWLQKNHPQPPPPAPTPFEKALEGAIITMPH
jgi:hypothetical protein